MENAYLPKNPDDPDTMLPPLDGRWWMTNGLAYQLHPSQNALLKLVKIGYEHRLQIEHKRPD